jgi:hypothetical protein
VEQVGGLVAGQRAQVDAVHQVVDPQRPHGVGRRGPAAQGADDGGLAEPREMVDDGRRQRVEQVRVVDDEHHRPAGTGARDGVDGPPHERGRKAGSGCGGRARRSGRRRLITGQRRHQAGHRKVGRGGPSGDCYQCVTGGIECFGGRAKQSTLANSWCSTNDQPASGGPGDRVGEPAQLERASDEGPGGHGRSI